MWTDGNKRQGRDGDVPMPIKSGMWFVRVYVAAVLLILASWGCIAVVAIVRGGQ